MRYWLIFTNFWKTPDDDELESIDLLDLEVYLNVSISAFDKLIGKYSKSEAKEVLLWIVSDEELTELVRDEDDEYAALKELFKEVAGEDNTHKPFVANIDGNDKLMEVVIEEGNEEAVEWFHEYITEEVNGCEGDDEDDISCFTVFCTIGQGIDQDSREDWLGFEDFEEYIEDIVDSQINAGSQSGQWDTNDIQDIDDVTDFYDELCGGLT